jgi:hypothetical protein
VSNSIAMLLASRTDAAAVSVAGASLSHFDAAGVCHVMLDGDAAPRAAKVLTTATGLQPGARLVVAIGLADAPVVLGAIAEAVPHEASPQKNLKLSAADSVSIECGDSAITLRHDGTVVIRGKQIVSRASGENKLRGSTVKIN